MDGNGVYYCDEDHDKKPHYFDWSDLKQVSVKRAPKESERKGSCCILSLKTILNTGLIFSHMSCQLCGLHGD